MSTQMLQELTIVIPTYNEASYLGGLLQDLCQQKDVLFNVVVSDSHSTDATQQIAESFADKLSLRFVAGQTRGPAEARNRGARAADEAWLLFLDADVRLLDPVFLNTLLSHAKHRDWSTATAHFVPSDSTRLSFVGSWLSLLYMRAWAHTGHPVALGSCILTRRSLFEEVGGFDETLAVAEDYDYVNRTAPHGFGFVGTTAYIYDMRRFMEGGNLKVFLKSFGYEVYRLTHHYRIARDPFNFKYGHRADKPSERR